jgi:hypothetical protein
MISLWLVRIFLFVSTTLAAGFSVQNHPFSLRLPSGWQQVLPNEQNLVFQGPEAEGTRPVLFVSHTGLQGVNFSGEVLERQIHSYYRGRSDYVASKGGTLLKFLPLRQASRGRNSPAFLTGVDYRVGRDVYHERSAYVSCGGSVFLVKTLDFREPASENSAAKAGESFRCAP